MSRTTRPLCLITGASSGIGAAMAWVFARHGWDIAITARRGDQLATLRDTITAAITNVGVMVLPADLADPTTPDALLHQITAGGRHLDGLVNNAGYGLPGGFLGTSWQQQAAFHQVMTTAPTQLCHRLIGPMMDRGFGRIINVASIAAMFPARAGHALYAASKAHMVALSESLHDETNRSGVHVTALCPGLTHSAFHDVNGQRARVERLTPPWMWMQADTVARAGYAACERNQPVHVCGSLNKALITLRRLMPDPLARALSPRSDPHNTGQRKNGPRV